VIISRNNEMPVQALHMGGCNCNRYAILVITGFAHLLETSLA
jgi:hypothetical protein